ncbi:MAG: hypothetical protein NXI11_00900 [Proteobacteria bacterium]|nr:hypothetical protein [Pseudomonadota bacterium]
MDEEQGIDVPEKVQECGLLDIPCHLNAVLQWIVDVVLWIPRKWFELVMNGLAAVVEAIPVPDAFAEIHTAAAGLASGTVWIFDIFAVAEGFAICMAALVARFFLRRVPLVG